MFEWKRRAERRCGCADREELQQIVHVDCAVTGDVLCARRRGAEGGQQLHIMLHIIGPGVPQMDGQDEAQVFQTCPPQSVPCVQVGAAGSGAAPPEHSAP